MKTCIQIRFLTFSLIPLGKRCGKFEMSLDDTTKEVENDGENNKKESENEQVGIEKCRMPHQMFSVNDQC